MDTNNNPQQIPPLTRKTPQDAASAAALPSLLPVEPNGIPQELISKRRWICWRLTPSDAKPKPDKIPINPMTGFKASATNPKTWTDFSSAYNASRKFDYSGVGYVFCAEDGIVGVDIDHCYTPPSSENSAGRFNDTAAAILSKQPTYAEFSPSGTGIHLYFRGKIDKAMKNDETGVEIYCNARYFTVTGQHVPGASGVIAEGDGTLPWIRDTFGKQPKEKIKKKKRGFGAKLNDEDLLEKAMSANDGQFAALWNGNWQDTYKSQSEADFALCCKLAFWSGRDKEQIDRLFRWSALMRPKWDEIHHSQGGGNDSAGAVTYGGETINRACDNTENAYNSDGDSPVFEMAGRYFRAKGDNIYPITNFIFQPVEMIISDDETQMTADLTTVNGEKYRLTFAGTDFGNLQRFKNNLNKRTISLTYTGNESDLELLKGYLSELEWIKKRGVKALGIHDNDGSHIFVSGDTAVNAKGEIVSDVVQIEKHRIMTSGILNANPITKAGLETLLPLLTAYNEPAKTVPALAWTAACFIKPHLRKNGVKFPHLFLIGEAGSGKSNTLERAILPVFGKTKVTAATQVTQFTLMRETSSSNMFPQALDEFKPSKIERFKLNVLYNHFRDSYDGHESVRGRIDQSVEIYELLAPLVVAGEESADEAAVHERGLELLFSKKDLQNSSRRAAFLAIRANSGGLESLGRGLLSAALGVSYLEVWDWYSAALKLFPAEFPARIVNNLACVWCGLLLLDKLCGSLGIAGFLDNAQFYKTQLEFAAKEYLLDGRMTNESVIEQTFEIISRMELDNNNDYEIVGNELRICLNRVYDRYTKYRRDYAVNGECLDYRQFMKQLKRSDLLIEANVTAKLNGKSHKCWKINFGLLKQRCDVSGFKEPESLPL